MTLKTSWTPFFIGLHPQPLTLSPKSNSTSSTVCPLYFSSFTKVNQGRVQRGGWRGSSLLGQRRKEVGGHEHEVGPPGRVLGPLEGKKWFQPSILSALF